jgi:Holliday junction resolvasome RuvABC DNA-binding subunit
MKDYVPILIEVDEPAHDETIEAMKSLGFTEDETFPAVPMLKEGTYVHRGWVKRENIELIKKTPGVSSVSDEGPTAPFQRTRESNRSNKRRERCE